jgi:hypothetical protein
VLLLALLERELQPLPLALVLLVGELARVHLRHLALLLPQRSGALLVDLLGRDELPLRRLGLLALLRFAPPARARDRVSLGLLLLRLRVLLLLGQRHR